MVGHKKYNGLQLDERTGTCFVGHGSSRDMKLPNDAPHRRAAVSPSLTPSAGGQTHAILRAEDRRRMAHPQKSKTQLQSELLERDQPSVQGAKQRTVATRF